MPVSYTHLEQSIGKEKRRKLYEDIYDDSLWLINLVENLLSVTRIEDGTMKLRLATELLDEVVGEALRHTDRRRCEHKIKIKQEEDFLLVKADARPVSYTHLRNASYLAGYAPEFPREFYGFDAGR